MTKFEDYSKLFSSISNEEDLADANLNTQIVKHFHDGLDISMPVSVYHKIMQFDRFVLIIRENAETEYSSGNYLSCEEGLWSIFNATRGDVAERLAILYRKQHRFSDEVNVLKLAIQSGTDNLKIQSRLPKAIAYCDKHRDSDESLRY
ncbi:hypothetical protein [Lactiplantibacillus pentosus]|uniref:hypothetical protein n=1 Tax=Lactiplantibacillus pentosus TaxID=1589 RepID=UPI003D2F1E06